MEERKALRPGIGLPCLQVGGPCAQAEVLLAADLACHPGGSDTTKGGRKEGGSSGGGGSLTCDLGCAVLSSRRETEREATGAPQKAAWITSPESRAGLRSFATPNPTAALLSQQALCPSSLLCLGSYATTLQGRLV